LGGPTRFPCVLCFALHGQVSSPSGCVGLHCVPATGGKQKKGLPPMASPFHPSRASARGAKHINSLVFYKL
jgi:hypothetical protein